MCSAYTDGKAVVAVYINYSTRERAISIECDKRKTGKVYVTSADKDLKYCGEQMLSSIVLPARSVVTIAM